MFFRISAILTVAFLSFSCMTGQRLGRIGEETGRVNLSIINDEAPPFYDDIDEVRTDSIESSPEDGPLIMNAIRDTETGEMVATDVISASRVTARFRNVAERGGRVTLQFDITVPSSLIQSDLQLKFQPVMKLYCNRANGGSGPATVLTDSLFLEPVFITGEGYRKQQLRGYERYAAFLNSIVTDNAVFIRKEQLEIFLRRYFPDTYAMKNDSSFVSEPMAENLFGVNQKTALEHYTRQLLKKRNDRKIRNKDKMFHKYVKDPIVTENIRLDTVLASVNGNLTYRYVQPLKAPAGLKKVVTGISGSVYRNGAVLCEMADIEDIVFYVSSLTTLMDKRPRYLYRIVEKTVRDNTNAFIDFEQGSYALDTSMTGNAMELKRIRKCFEDVYGKTDLEVDSIVVTASCSPEGSFGHNRKLAEKRSLSIMEYVSEHFHNSECEYLRASSVPENWELFTKLVQNDTVLDERRKTAIAELSRMEDKDRAEVLLSRMPEYRYLRGKIYPMLRTVCFDFYLHRKNMQKDTVHTTELDTLYMNGLEALGNADYKKASLLLKPYKDYNAALALASAGYDHTALSVLAELGKCDAKALYLRALLKSRVGSVDEALGDFEEAVALEPSMIHRANLDPEMTAVLKRMGKHKQ